MASRSDPPHEQVTLTPAERRTVAQLEELLRAHDEAGASA